MSTWVTNVNSEKTAINSAVTTKIAPSSISPIDVGNNMEALCTLLKTLGWDGDTTTFIETIFKIITSDGTNKLTLDGSEVKIIDLAGSFDQIGLNFQGANPYFFIKSTSNPNIGKIVASAFSAPHTWTLPDKDGIFAMLSDIISAGNLQAVCTVGNETNTGIYIGSGTFASPTTGVLINSLGRMDFYNGGVVVGIFDQSTGGLEIVSADPYGSGFFSNIDTGHLTSNRQYILPDEGSGFNLDSTFMLHNTKDSVLIGTGGSVASPTDGVYIDSGGGVQILSGSDLYVSLGISSGKGTLSLDDNSGNDGRIQAFGLTTQRTILIPDEGNGSGLNDTIVLHKTKDTINVDAGGASKTAMATGAFSAQNASYIMALGASALALTKISTGFSATLSFIDPTANRSVSVPDQSGDIVINHGVTNQSSGALVGATNVAITHGLGFTPNRIFITPKDAATGAALVGYWVSAIGGTTFQLNFPVFTGTLIFDWQAF